MARQPSELFEQCLPVLQQEHEEGREASKFRLRSEEVHIVELIVSTRGEADGSRGGWGSHVGQSVGSHGCATETANTRR